MRVSLYSGPRPTSSSPCRIGRRTPALAFRELLVVSLAVVGARGLYAGDHVVQEVEVSALVDGVTDVAGGAAYDDALLPAATLMVEIPDIIRRTMMARTPNISRPRSSWSRPPQDAEQETRHGEHGADH